MNSAFKMPFYVKAAFIFVSLFAIVFIMHIARGIIVPLIFATIIAILLNPMVNYLGRKKMNNIVSISIAVILAMVILLGILSVVSTQLSMFSEAYPRLKLKFNESSYKLVQWVSSTFNVRVKKINAWTKETQNDAISNFEIG
jgi:predicted PurR-regulated permease PerM